MTITKPTALDKMLRDKISKGRTHIILRDPFFATILMDMETKIDHDTARTETCGTDGDNLVFNADWLAEAEPLVIAAALRKMALHAALAHPLRRRSRTPRKWQAACDQATWHVMEGDNVELPVGAEPNPFFKGMTAEAIYRAMEEGDDGDEDGDSGDGGGGSAGSAGGQGDGDGDGDGQGDGQGGGVGHTMDSPHSGDAAGMAEAERKNDQRVIRASMAAKAAGKGSAMADRLVDDIRSRGPDWREKLHAFVDNSVETDFAWSRPNRRFVHQGIYLPGQVADGLSTLGFVIDTSGSIDKETLSVFMGQLNAAREAIGIEKVIVVYCDDEVGRVDEFHHGEEVVANAIGGGGTDMAPAMEFLRDKDCNAVICLTDGIFFEELETSPGCPTLFALYGGYSDENPATYGEALTLPQAA